MGGHIGFEIRGCRPRTLLSELDGLLDLGGCLLLDVLVFFVCEPVSVLHGRAENFDWIAVSFPFFDFVRRTILLFVTQAVAIEPVRPGFNKCGSFPSAGTGNGFTGYLINFQRILPIY